MQNENAEDSLKVLREKTGQQLLNSEFKKNIFGGISQKEVVQYFNNLKDQAQQAEDTFKGRIEELTASRDTLKQENKLLDEQLSAITTSVTEYKLEITRLECERDSLEKRYREIEVRQQEQELYLKLAEADRSDLRGEVEQLKELLNQKENTIGELNKKVTEVEDKEEYEKRIQVMDNTITHMSLSLSKKDKQMERDSQILVKLQKEKSDTELLNESLRTDLANTYSQLEEQIKANHRLVMQLEKERIRVSDLEHRNNELEDKILALHNLNQEYQVQSDGLVQNLEKKYDSAFVLMTDGLQDIMGQLKQYKNDLVITNKERKELSDTNIERFAQICSQAHTDMREVQRPSNIISLPKYKVSGD